MSSFSTIDCEAFLNDFPHLKLLFREVRAQLGLARSVLKPCLLQTQSLFISATIVLVLLTRSAGVAFFGMGVTVVCMLAKKLKRILRQPRPVGTDKVTYGYVYCHCHCHVHVHLPLVPDCDTDTS